MSEPIFNADSTSTDLFESLGPEFELVRQAGALPHLCPRVRSRILSAAQRAYRQTRRWVLTQQAATFLAFCLVFSLVLSPLVQASWNGASRLRTQVASLRAALADPTIERHEVSWSPSSAWQIRRDLNLSPSRVKSLLRPRVPMVQTVARVDVSEDALPRDELLVALQASDGWETVDAYEAIRARGLATLQKALCAN